MSKSNTNVNKGKKLRASVSSLKLLNTNGDVSLLNHWLLFLRPQNKKEKFNGAAKNSTVKAQRYMDSRSDVRQVST